MAVSTVIFDMDGLLIDSEPLWYEAAKESFAHLGVSINQEEYNETTGLRTREFLHHWFTHFNIDLSLIENTDQDITSRVIEKVSDKGVVMEGVYSSIEMVQRAGLKIGLASSSPMSLIEAVIEKMNLKNVFSVLTSAEALPFGKPNPQVFINCANELNSHPTHCLCVEDSFNGMIAAKAARMKCVVVPHPDQYPQDRWNIADLKLRSLLEWDEKQLFQLMQ
jgi:beta-phosphoglucomutase-like phosphatase (HAD superfamily)